jgi:hypothetical protein
VTVCDEFTCAGPGGQYDAGSSENTPAACSNGMDDDGDGFTDCRDFNCCRRTDAGPAIRPPGVTACDEFTCVGPGNP